VLGCGGAGKTFVAGALGARLGLPVVHADEIVFRGGALRPESEWQAELNAHADGDASPGDDGGRRPAPPSPRAAVPDRRPSATRLLSNLVAQVGFPHSGCSPSAVVAPHRRSERLPPA
jgi:hypothetical protein